MGSLLLLDVRETQTRIIGEQLLPVAVFSGVDDVLLNDYIELHLVTLTSDIL